MTSANQNELSIIVPVYNVEKYLRACLNRLTNIDSEIEKKIEIILVDDGSIDGSSEICDEYADKYSYFKVIHQKNGGLSNARNSALKIATGKYTSFIDSDDMIISNYINLVLKLIEYAECADIIVFNHKKFSIDSAVFACPLKFDKQKLLNIDKSTAMYDLTTEDGGNYFWNKIFKSELFKDEYLPEGIIYEDITTMYKYFEKANNIKKYNEIMYFYRQREGSISHLKSPTYKDKISLLKESISARTNQANFFKKNGYIVALNNSLHYLMTDQVFYIVWTIESNGNRDNYYVNAVNFIRKYKPNINDGWLFYVFIKLFNTTPKLTQLILKLRNRF